jgi:hypothetical protein
MGEACGRQHPNAKIRFQRDMSSALNLGDMLEMLETEFGRVRKWVLSSRKTSLAKLMM